MTDKTSIRDHREKTTLEHKVSLFREIVNAETDGTSVSTVSKEVPMFIVYSSKDLGDLQADIEELGKEHDLGPYPLVRGLNIRYVYEDGKRSATNGTYVLMSADKYAVLSSIPDSGVKVVPYIYHKRDLPNPKTQSWNIFISIEDYEDNPVSLSEFRSNVEKWMNIFVELKFCREYSLWISEDKESEEGYRGYGFLSFPLDTSHASITSMKLFLDNKCFLVGEASAEETEEDIETRARRFKTQWRRRKDKSSRRKDEYGLVNKEKPREKTKKEEKRTEKRTEEQKQLRKKKDGRGSFKNGSKKHAYRAK